MVLAIVVSFGSVGEDGAGDGGATTLPTAELAQVVVVQVVLKVVVRSCDGPLV